MGVLGLTSTILRGDKHVETEFAGQTLMMSVDQGKYFVVDATAKRIWDLLANPMRLQDVVAVLIEEFDIDVHTCEREVLAFVEQLRRNELIVECAP